MINLLKNVMPLKVGKNFMNHWISLWNSWSSLILFLWLLALNVMRILLMKDLAGIMHLCI